MKTSPSLLVKLASAAYYAVVVLGILFLFTLILAGLGAEA